MLLLVMQPELNERVRGMLRVVAHALQKIAHRFVHVGAILEHFANRGPRDEPALGAAMALTCLHVIRIEQIRVPRIW